MQEVSGLIMTHFHFPPARATTSFTLEAKNVPPPSSTRRILGVVESQQYHHMDLCVYQLTETGVA